MAAADGVLTCWSTGAEQLLGLSAAEAVGLPAAELLASALPAAARERFARQEGWTGPVALRHQDGSAVECRLRACPLPTGDGRAGWLLEGVPVREETERDTDPLIR
ncbi:PAS domain-containing protein, partial [Streptomyces mirabilis]|uniref:PAS domain-containing protein n=1 Tax=Streptomyces mirabilis TaxID=68239 RepID=UPI003686E6B2